MNDCTCQKKEKSYKDQQTQEDQISTIGFCETWLNVSKPTFDNWFAHRKDSSILFSVEL